jgi:hypothetical protein
LVNGCVGRSIRRGLLQEAGNFCRSGRARLVKEGDGVEGFALSNSLASASISLGENMSLRTKRNIVEFLLVICSCNGRLLNRG